MSNCCVLLMGVVNSPTCRPPSGGFASTSSQSLHVVPKYPSVMLVWCDRLVTATDFAFFCFVCVSVCKCVCLCSVRGGQSRFKRC